MLIRGVVVNYNSGKGFGFIKSSSFERDLFFHVSEFDPDEMPVRYMQVAFELKESADGRKSACNIRVLHAPNEAKSKIDIENRQRMLHKKTPSKQEYMADVKLKELPDFRAEYVGTLSLNDRQLKFEGSSWITRKVITRQIRFITSVEVSLFGPYVITGGGPKLHIESSKFLFNKGDIKSLFSALKKLI